MEASYLMYHHKWPYLIVYDVVFCVYSSLAIVSGEENAACVVFVLVHICDFLLKLSLVYIDYDNISWLLL